MICISLKIFKLNYFCPESKYQIFHFIFLCFPWLQDFQGDIATPRYRIKWFEIKKICCCKIVANLDKPSKMCLPYFFLLFFLCLRLSKKLSNVSIEQPTYLFTWILVGLAPVRGILQLQLLTIVFNCQLHRCFCFYSEDDRYFSNFSLKVFRFRDFLI